MVSPGEIDQSNDDTLRTVNATERQTITPGRRMRRETIAVSKPVANVAIPNSRLIEPTLNTTNASSQGTENTNRASNQNVALRTLFEDALILVEHYFRGERT
jgi:hypothetical protein